MTFSTLSSRQAGRHRTDHAGAPTGRQTEQRTGRQIERWSRQAGRTDTLGRQDIEAASKYRPAGRKYII